MKFINNLKFPYPVLYEDGGDYVDSHFKIGRTLVKNEEKNVLELTITPDIKCPFLEELLVSGKVKIVCHVEQKTYRAIFGIGKTIEIPLDNIAPDHNLEVVCMIIAAEDFSFPYHISMKHIYSLFDNDFTCYKGSILAYSNFVEFALPSSDKISSIFTISKFKNVDDIKSGIPFKIRLDSDVIDILVQPQIQDNFILLRTQNPTSNKLLNALFVYPAVQLAISEAYSNYNDYKDYKWCIAITNKIANEKQVSFDSIQKSGAVIDKEELIEFTHIILEDLFTAAFEYAGQIDLEEE